MIRSFSRGPWLAGLMLCFFALLTPALARASSQIVITTDSGKLHFTAEWATTEAEREQGLMGRQHMAEDHGMIFDFGTEQPVVFWMKDTPIPLDMIFIAADGTIRRIAANTRPYSLDMIPSASPVRYVLEINGGLARRLGIGPGSKVDVGTP